MSILRTTLFCYIFMSLVIGDLVYSRSLQDAQKEYNNLQREVSDPAVIWITQTAPIVPNFILKHGFYSLEEFIVDFRAASQVAGYDIDMYTKKLVRMIKLSELAKQDAKERLLPQLEKVIRQLEQQEHVSSIPENQQWSTPAERGEASSSFSDVMVQLNNRNYSLEGAMASSSGNGTPISDSQSSTWDDTNNYFHASCPPTSNKGIFRIYPNNIKGDTYVECNYSGNGGNDLWQVKPVVDGKTDGTLLQYNRYGTGTYLSARRNYKQGKYEGIVESWGVSRSGAVYRKSMSQHGNGKKNGGQVIYWDNGNEKVSSIYHNGKVVGKVYKYRRDGSLQSCMEYKNGSGSTCRK